MKVLHRAVACLLLSLSLSSCAAAMEQRNYNSDWPPLDSDSTRLGSVEFGPRPPLRQKWVFQTSGRITDPPAIKDGKVYVGARADKVYALDLINGTKLWDMEVPDGSINGSPVVNTSGIFAGKGAGTLFYVYGWDSNGQEIWNHESGETEPPPWVLADAGQVYTNFDPPSSDRMGQGVQMTALDTAKGNILWQTPIEGKPMVTPALSAELLIVASSDKHVYAIDRATGAIRWRAELDSEPASSPLISGGRIYLSTRSGFLVAFGLDGLLAWSYQFPRQAQNQPSPGNPASQSLEGEPAVLQGDLALSGQLIVVPSARVMYGFDLAELKPRWAFRSNQDLAEPVASSEYVYFGSSGNTLYVLSLRNGAIVGNLRVGAEILGAPVLAGGLVLVGASDGKLYAFEELPRPATVQRPGPQNKPPAWMQRR